MEKVKGSLQGIDGNAFMLMGYFQKLAKQQGFAKEWIQSVLDEARSEDYDHLVETLLYNMTEPYPPWHCGSSPSPPNGGTSSSMSRED